jgi:hypothetical protein
MQQLMLMTGTAIWQVTVPDFNLWTEFLAFLANMKVACMKNAPAYLTTASKFLKHNSQIVKNKEHKLKGKPLYSLSPNSANVLYQRLISLLL